MAMSPTQVTKTTNSVSVSNVFFKLLLLLLCKIDSNKLKYVAFHSLVKLPNSQGEPHKQGDVNQLVDHMKQEWQAKHAKNFLLGEHTFPQRKRCIEGPKKLIYAYFEQSISSCKINSGHKKLNRTENFPLQSLEMRLRLTQQVSRAVHVRRI